MEKKEMISLIKKHITEEKNISNCNTCICNNGHITLSGINGSMCLKRFFTILCTLYDKKAYEIFEKIKQDYGMQLNMNCRNREIFIYVLRSIKNNFDLE